MHFLEGFGFGLATVILIGPVFFTLLKAALDHGAAGGITVALGIIISDIMIVAICLSGLMAIVQSNMSELWIAVAAGCILLVLGIRYLMAPVPELTEMTLGKRGALGLFISGFLVNFMNPFVFVIWIGLSLHGITHYGKGCGQQVFLLGVLSGIFTTDLLKALLAPRLRRLLSPTYLRKLYVVIGLAMLVFSIRLFIHAVSLTT